MYTLIVIGLFTSVNGGVATPVVNVPNISYQECTIQGKQIAANLADAPYSKATTFSCILQAEPK